MNKVTISAYQCFCPSERATTTENTKVTTPVELLATWSLLMLLQRSRGRGDFGDPGRWPSTLASHLAAIKPIFGTSEIEKQRHGIYFGLWTQFHFTPGRMFAHF